MSDMPTTPEEWGRAEAAEAERDRLAERVAELGDLTRERILSWLGLEADEACPGCGGVGRRVYSTTATWRGGAGGCQMTPGVCDGCWGSGSTHRKGVDLRRLSARVAELEASIQTEHYRAQRELLLCLWREIEGDQDGDAPGNHLLETGLVAAARARDERIGWLEARVAELEADSAETMIEADAKFDRMGIVEVADAE